MKQQIATSIEQSKKLLELGLKRETADMFWRHCNLDNHDYLITIDEYEKIYEANTPAWSLNALLKLLPQKIYHNHNSCHWDINSMNINGCGYIMYRDELTGYILFKTKKDTLLNAVFSMVVFLLNNSFIETDK